MTRPNFLEGVLFALVASAAAGIFVALFAPFLGGLNAHYATLSTLTFVYVCYLLIRSGERIGRIVTVALLCTVMGSCALLSPLLWEYALILTLFVWFVRCMYFHSSLTASAIDLSVNVVAAAAALWCWSHTSSVVLTVWCFFLLQALFCMIPSAGFGEQRARRDATTADFANAHRRAENALRKLSSTA